MGFQANGDAMAQGYSILILVLMFVAMYFFMIRPQSKKKKQEDQMRASLQIGDEITTIGGIIGRIVSIKEDSDYVVIETGADRTKMKLRRWAIASCDSNHEPAQK